MYDVRKIQENVIWKAVKEQSNEKTATEIVYGRGEEARAENNTDWVKSTMSRLEETFPTEKIRQIRRNCQCGYGMDEREELVRELFTGATSMEEFADSPKAREAGLFCRDGILHLQFLFCPCPMVAEVDVLKTDTWCQCTTGYSKVLFEKVFGCEVEVELLQSIKMGQDSCLMKIIPLAEIWSKK